MNTSDLLNESVMKGVGYDGERKAYFWGSGVLLLYFMGNINISGLFMKVVKGIPSLLRSS